MDLKPKITVLLLAIGLSLATFVVNAEVVVIASAGSPVASLTSEQVAAIFLKRTNKLPDGTAVEAIDLPEGSTIRDEFYEKAAAKNPSQLKAYWAKRIFTGKGQPNDVLTSEAAVKSWVVSGSGRLAYVSPASVDDSVKVLLKLP